MSDEAEAGAFTCPFCGRAYPEQDRLTDHFEQDHGFDPAIRP